MDSNETQSLLQLNPWDSGVILLYLVIVVVMAWHVRKGQKNTEDYFLAGRSMHWVVVAISLFATLFSTISFVAVPGEAYKNGALLYLGSVAFLLGLPIAIIVFLKYFYQQKIFTAYEYLERRFNGWVRLGGSISFMIARLLYGATVLYAASKLMDAFVGWPEWTTILIVGLITIVYTTIGGMRAVMFTDVFQSAVLFLGLIGVIGKLLAFVDFDVFAIFQYAHENQHFFNKMAEPEFYSFNPYIRYTVWLFLLAIITSPATNVSTDQLAVQRLLSGKGFAEAKKSLYLKAALGILAMTIFYFVGLGLYQFYRTGASVLPEGIQADQVLGYFIKTELPPPFPGLLVAALLAALMSTVDSTVNSLSTVLNKDILQRYRLASNLEQKQLFMGRLMSATWGVTIVLMALALSFLTGGIHSTVLEVGAILSSIWGVLFVVFFLGVTTKWATSMGVLTGMVVGVTLNLVMPYVLYFNVDAAERISFAWVGLPGLVSALVLSVVVSLVFPKRDRTEVSTRFDEEEIAVGSNRDKS
ncbi:sodium/solute symporter [bacterium]|nr:sodium/solute symporter [bacterium]